MTDFVRATAQKSATLKASAQDAYALITDWGGLERWYPKESPVVIQRIELLGPPDKLPLARVLHAADGRQVPETLLVKNDLTKRIYYSLADGALPGIVGYVCTNTMDEVDENTTLFTFQSTFDVTDSALGAEGGRQMVEAIYTRLLGGLAAYFEHGGA